MTCVLDATKPLPTDLITSLDDYLRETRAAINTLCGMVGGGIIIPEYNSVVMAGGGTDLEIGTELSDVGQEVVGLTASGAVNLTTISGGTAGQIKIIIAFDTNITVVQGAPTALGGVFYLNSPVGVNLEMETRDVLAIVNVGGDGDTVDGYWVELWRKLQV